MRPAARYSGFAALVAAAFLVAGCATGGAGARPADLAGRTGVAMLPLENLTGKSENGERYSRLLWATLGKNARYRVVDVGEVDAAIGELRIRNAGSLTREQVQKVATRLKVRWIVAGTLLECGSIHTPDGDVPSFGMTLRVLDGKSGDVVWADLRARTGEDRETIFGWGRESSLDRLAETTARELVAHMQFPATPDSAASTEVTR